MNFPQRNTQPLKKCTHKTWWLKGWGFFWPEQPPPDEGRATLETVKLLFTVLAKLWARDKAKKNLPCHSRYPHQTHSALIPQKALL